MDILSDSQDRSLTLQEVEANPYLAKQVRKQAAAMLAELGERGEVWWSGRGYHRTLVPVRAFALRVLIAKKMLRQSATDSRVYVAA
jgi:hypothetical protein